MLWSFRVFLRLLHLSSSLSRPSRVPRLGRVLGWSLLDLEESHGSHVVDLALGACDLPALSSRGEILAGCQQFLGHLVEVGILSAALVTTRSLLSRAGYHVDIAILVHLPAVIRFLVLVVARGWWSGVAHGDRRSRKLGSQFQTGSFLHLLLCPEVEMTLIIL